MSIISRFSIVKRQVRARVFSLSIYDTILIYIVSSHMPFEVVFTTIQRKFYCIHRGTPMPSANLRRGSPPCSKVAKGQSEKFQLYLLIQMSQSVPANQTTQTAESTIRFWLSLLNHQFTLSFRQLPCDTQSFTWKQASLRMNEHGQQCHAIKKQS